MRLIVIVALSLLLALVDVVRADLPLDISYSAGCIPINVTWTPDKAAYPYTVWIASVASAVDAFAIDSSYPLVDGRITFQYQAPAATSISTYVIAVADSKGNGNVSDIESYTSLPGTSCPGYLGNNNWAWVFESLANPPLGYDEYAQCGSVGAYNDDFRGEGPFTLTYLPIGGVPMTINVPVASQTSATSFVYNTTVPLKAGTKFLATMGDTPFGGGSGGVSRLLTVVAQGGNSDCLAAGYRPANLNTTNFLPIATSTAVFANVAGALPASFRPPHSSTNRVPLIGGLIGAAVALILAASAVVAYLAYRRRRERQRQSELVAEPKFVDLGTGDDQRGLGARVLRNRRTDQSYSVSPYINDGTSSSMRPFMSSSHPPSDDSYARPSSGGANSFGVAGGPPDSGTHPNPRHSNALSSPDVNRFSSADVYSVHSVSHQPSPHDYPPVPTSRPDEPLQAHAAGNGNEEVLADAQAYTGRRVVMHTDGGALPQPESDDEDEIDELPPQYAQYGNANATSREEASAVANQDR